MFWSLDARMIKNQASLEDKLRENPDLGKTAKTMLDAEAAYVKQITDQVWKQISTAPWNVEDKSALLRAMIAYLYRAKMQEDKPVIDFGAVLRELIPAKEEKK